MVLKILGYLGMAVVVALLVQTMMTTYYLGKIDSGLKTSLDSTGHLIQIQSAIIHKNEALQDVVKTTKAMDAQLGNTLQATQVIHDHIDKINDLNSQTLQLNRNMVTVAGQSGQTLGSISSGMGDLKQATQALAQSLEQLKQWIQQDNANMGQMKSDTDQMNQKVPEVLK